MLRGFNLEDQELVLPLPLPLPLDSAGAMLPAPKPGPGDDPRACCCDATYASRWSCGIGHWPADDVGICTFGCWGWGCSVGGADGCLSIFCAISGLLCIGHPGGGTDPLELGLVACSCACLYAMSAATACWLLAGRPKSEPGED